MSQISVRIAGNVARQLAKATPQVCHIFISLNFRKPGRWKKKFVKSTCELFVY